MICVNPPPGPLPVWEGELLGLSGVWFLCPGRGGVCVNPPPGPLPNWEGEMDRQKRLLVPLPSQGRGQGRGHES